jgi:dual specificity phosphatase 12
MVHAHEIIPRLWLGNIKAAMDTDFLRQHDISAVFNCTKDLPFNTSVPTRKYRLAVDDNLQPEEIKNMELWAPETVMLVIQEYNRGSHILIHCAAGMQRSAAIMAMTLMVLRTMRSEEAIKYIHSIRPIAFTPAVNFRKAITGFERYYNESIVSQLDNSGNSANFKKSN